MPIYEALLERDLFRDGSHIKLKEPMVMDFLIEQGAPFVGREVRLLGLPPGCVLVRCTQGARVFVPTATTTLDAHMKITVVIAPEAAHGLTNLRMDVKAERRENKIHHKSGSGNHYDLDCRELFFKSVFSEPPCLGIFI